MSEKKDSSEEKIAQLQLMEQNMQQFLMQKQHIQGQLTEIESALANIKGSKNTYKIIANIMVSADSDTVEKELIQKKEVYELRIKSLDKQENAIKDRAEQLRKEVLGQLDK